MSEELFIYADELEYHPGDSVDVYISATEPSEAVVSLVRPRTVGATDGFDFSYSTVETVESLRVTTEFQPTFNGSFGVVSDVVAPRSSELTIAAFVWPTRARGAAQTIVSWQPRHGGALELSKDTDGRLTAARRSSDGAVQSAVIEDALVERQWYLVAAVVQADGALVVCQIPLRSTDPNDIAQQTVTDGASFITELGGTGRVVIAASEVRNAPNGDPRVESAFDGKIEAPSLFSRATTLDLLKSVDPADIAWADDAFAAWRFDSDFETNAFTSIRDDQPGGTLYNAPSRGMTGRNWTGRHLDFRYAPSEYGAIHFHSDDLEDAAWKRSASIKLPVDLASDIYGILVESSSISDHVPIFVSPAKGQRSSDVLFLAPTFSYIAYANNRIDRDFDYSGGTLTDLDVAISERDKQAWSHDEFGSSLYDHHIDGSGVCYSTYLRPIPNMRWDYMNSLQSAPRHFPVDLVWPSWLEKEGISYDVLSDHGLHERGAEAMSGYRVVVTGSHPEYWSSAMLDAVEEYLDGGGSFVNTGGNGFYWVTSASGERPHLLEVRRGQQGIRTWEGAPGEGTATQSFEPGGLWRLRGRAPNKLVGVGMAAQGWDTNTPGFVKTEDAANERVSDLFLGIGDEVIGDFGLVLGGAAGDEIDRADVGLGTPRHALVIARSQAHSQYYLAAPEELPIPTPNINGTNNPNVRADITFFETGSGGFVISTSAISWTGSVAYQYFNNNVARFMRNVMNKALGQERLSQ